MPGRWSAGIRLQRSVDLSLESPGFAGLVISSQLMPATESWADFRVATIGRRTIGPSRPKYYKWADIWPGPSFLEQFTDEQVA